MNADIKGEGPGVRLFEPKDQLLELLQTEFRAKPQLLESIQPLFRHNLTELRDEVVAVRSDDLLTFLSYFSEGRIPVSVDKQKSKMKKKQGWFYMTPLPALEKCEKDLEVLKHNNGFYEEAALNVNLYATKLAFINEFRRNVEPVLQADWLAKLVKMSGKMEIGTATKDRDIIFEDFMDGLLEEMDQLNRGKRLYHSRYGRLNYTEGLARLVRDGVELDSVVVYLKTVQATRGGILVGFNQRVLQGKVVDAWSDRLEIIHDGAEIAFKPKKGFIDLAVNPISAIEPLGEWEDETIKRLQLV